jgi:hypothetical protein
MIVVVNGKFLLWTPDDISHIVRYHEYFYLPDLTTILMVIFVYSLQYFNVPDMMVHNKKKLPMTTPIIIIFIYSLQVKYCKRK